MTQEVETVTRKVANSGNVSYADPIVLNETSKSRSIAIPFYIPHSDRTELALKLETYKKSPPPLDWVLVDKKTFSLGEASTRKLHEVLKTHLAVASENSDGEYLLIRVAEGTAHLGTHAPEEVASALMKVLSQEEIYSHLQGLELASELTDALRSSIRLSEMRNAVAELRNALDAGDNLESTYQGWCERHSWAFGNAYVLHDDIREISPGDHLDLLLPSVIAGYRDIVELKRPDMEVLKWDSSHKNHYFTSDVSKAIGQCHRYLDVLSEVAAKGLRDHPEIVAYHPRATIVIGRSNDWDEDKLRSLHGLNRRLAGVSIMTYDQLLSQGERLISILSPKDYDIGDEEKNDDDFPF